MGGVISTLANAPPDDRSARDNRCEIYVRRTQTGEKWIFTFSSEVDIGKEYQNEAETNGVEYCVQYFDKDYLARSKEGIDYTQFFAPLRMWPLLRRTADIVRSLHRWTADSSHYDVPSDEGDQTRIAFRMTDLVQSILTCQAALERIERLRELGMLEGGKVAAIQAKTTGPIQETYSILHSYTESLMVKKQSELQIFAGDMGVRKGKRIWFQSQPKLPYDITNQTLESHILVMESDSVLAL
ncbi:uncharacterized protein L199_006830 [Kwoniella botswanensis]|uniref:uncharacterized protein n=1 Tax=Kwoniella botswanensis TaxID=1268659 RepID=UPI00315CB045